MEEKRRIVEEYEINPYTMIIMPFQYGSRVYSKIYELHDEYISPFKPLELVKKSCEYFGSSYQGRRDGTKRLIGVTHKAPIIIDPHTSIYLFPTLSPTKIDCMWISHEHIVAHTCINSYDTEVLFHNNQTVTIPISSSSFESQLGRTARLRVKFEQQIKNMEKPFRERILIKNAKKASESSQPYAID
ncbi:competence protein ComK [Oikeobacillus pervagus]|uniref:Competence protein ComK n=1 Tax=Oikeobacillus pervagus TaxID=1325931 RepID=A0AAJ1SXW7_9BACI|nr:competence protein ComK [Oikeobacillus pervagus]MDQ0214780.1 competence protein ComK [Oikeobacillus pervagus]